jgi:hypothetical protein
VRMNSMNAPDAPFRAAVFILAIASVVRHSV